MINFHWFFAPSFWDLAAIIISFVSLVYTFFSNRYSIDLTNFELREDRDHLLFSYQITNDSPKTLKVLNIKMFCGSDEIPILDFDEFEYDRLLNKVKSDQWDYENTQPYMNVPVAMNPYKFNPPLTISLTQKPELPLVMPPYSQETFTFYVKKKPDKITIYSNKRLGLVKNRTFNAD